MGEQMRTTVQLVETATDTQVWAGNYDRPATEIFTVQDEMTRAIAGALFVNMSQKDLERAKRKPPTSLSAYELFLRGREQAIKNTPEGQARAIEFYQQSLAVDPTYADAMGALAQAYSYGFTMHTGPLQGMQHSTVPLRLLSALSLSTQRHRTRRGHYQWPTYLQTALRTLFLCSSSH